jgi:hypothetical protein
MLISVFVRWWSWTQKRADLLATMTCEPGPGLGDRRRWRPDPGAYPAAGGELSQVQHQVGLETPHTRAPRPGYAGNGPLPIPRMAVSRRFRSASHSGVATARSSLMTAALRADRTQLHARQRTLSLVTSGGLISFLVWAMGTAAGCRSSCGSASTRCSYDAARPRSVWPARDHSSSPPELRPAVRPVLAELRCWIVAADRCPRYLPGAVLRAVFCEALAPLIASCCRLLSAMALPSEAERLGERTSWGYAHRSLTI